jgi:hypothetical protein
MAQLQHRPFGAIRQSNSSYVTSITVFSKGVSSPINTAYYPTKSSGWAIDAVLVTRSTHHYGDACMEGRKGQQRTRYQSKESMYVHTLQLS